MIQTTLMIMTNTEFKTVTNIYTGELTDSAIVNAKEIEIIKKLVTAKDIVLDIGANIGFMTIQLAQLAKHVYAFEPSPDNFKQLQENTKHLDNVTLENIALSDKEDIKTLYLCPYDNGMNRLYPSKWCEGGDIVKEIPTYSLDWYIIFWRLYDENLHNKISFIKLDVEGYEYYAIRGMEKLLQRDHPTILLEFHPPSIIESKSNPKDIYDLLKDELGYNDPINCNTDETITSYQELDKQTRDTPAVNILWKYK
jgi:FkbM family methyltransferase